MAFSSPAHQELLAIEPDARVQFVESRLVAWIDAARSQEAQPSDESPSRQIDGSTPLSELGVDSLQLVDIKFELDELVGRELDVGLFIRNPTIRELAQESLRACNL